MYTLLLSTIVYAKRADPLLAVRLAALIYRVDLHIFCVFEEKKVFVPTLIYHIV